MTTVTIQNHPTVVTISKVGVQGPPGDVTPELEALRDQVAQAAGGVAGSAQAAEDAATQAEAARAAALAASDTAATAASAATGAVQAAAAVRDETFAAVQGERYGVATRAELNALSVPVGTMRAVTNDSVPENNGAWRRTASGWEKAVDRASQLAGSIVSATDALGGHVVSDNGDLVLSPASLFKGGARGAYYDPSVLGSLFQDAAGTIPVTAEGQPVRRMNDLSGNGNHLTLGHATIPMTYGRMFGRPCLIAPAGSFLTQPGLPGPVEMERTCYIGAAFAPTAAGTANFFGVGSSNANGLYLAGLATFSRGTMALRMTGKATVELQTPAAALSLNLPITMDGLSSDTVSSWINGGKLSVPEPSAGTNGGPRSRPTNWEPTDKLTGCRYGINNAGGLSQSTAAQVFFGGLVYHGDPGPRRVGINRWLRWKAGHGVLDHETYDVFLVAGQSNAQGVGDFTQSTPVPFGAAIEYNAFDSFKPLADPMQMRDPSDYSRTGSAWPAFATKYNALTGRKVCMVGFAASGVGIIQPTTVENWGNTSMGALPRRAARKLMGAIACLERHGCTAVPRGVLYIGGEQDAIAVLNLATYKAHLVALRDRFRLETGIPTLPLLILSIDDKADDQADYALIRQAMVEVAAENSGIHLVMPYQNFRAAEMLSDGLHWNQAALNIAGEIAATNVAALP